MTTDELTARLALDKFFDPKHEVCVIRAKVPSLNVDETKAS